MSRGPDVSTLLERALIAAAAAAGCPITICDGRWDRWASATFTGARHGMTLVGTAGEALRDWLAALPDADFALRGHLVADLSVAAVRSEDGALLAAIEVLTVEER